MNVAARACSTAACERVPRPGWAICDDCTLDLLLPDREPPRTVVRLSALDPMFASTPGPAPRPGQPDLAVPVGMGSARGESRDGAVRPEVPARALGASRPAGYRHEAGRISPHPPGPLDPGQVSSARESGDSRSPAPVCRAGVRDTKRGRRARAAQLDTPSRPGAELQGVARIKSTGAPRVTAGVHDAGQPDGDWAGSQRAIATAPAAASPGRSAPA